MNIRGDYLIALSLALPLCMAQETGVPARSAVMNVMQTSAASTIHGGGRRVEIKRPRLQRRGSPTAAPATSFLPSPSIPVTEPFGAPTAAAATSQLPMNGFPAMLDNLLASPPDSMGAVSAQHVVTMLTTGFQVQTRTGTVLVNMALEDFWSPVFGATEAGAVVQPRVQYDPFTKHWFTSGLLLLTTNATAVLIGGSQTSDPTGNWNLYRIDIDPGANKINGDWDVLGFNSNWVVVSIDVYKGFMYDHSNLYLFAKTDLSAARVAAKASYKTFTDTYGPFVPATDYDNIPNRMFLLQEDFGRFSGLIVSEIQGGVGSEVFYPERGYVKPADFWANTPMDTYEIGPQMGSKTMIDTFDSRLQNCVVRNNAIWCTQTIFLPPTNPHRASVQWWQIGTSPYQVMQRGRIDDPTGTTMYAFPSIAVNKNGDVLVGYNRFSPTQYVSANYSFRASADPAGTTQTDAVIKTGEAPYVDSSGVNLWGSFSHTQVDPMDDLSFWTIQEYAASPTPSGTSLWGTWWAQITPMAAGKTCAWSLSKATQSAPSAAGTGSVDVATTAGCNWMAAPNAPWIVVTSGGNGTASGTVNYTIAANPKTAARTGTLTIAGQTVTVTQAAAPPSPDLVITALTAPTTATLGDKIAVTATVKNQGTGKAGAFRVGFYFSATAADLGKDVFSGSSCSIDQLDIGATAPCNISVAVPATLRPGTAYLRAVADDQGVITETDHSDSERVADSGPITLQAPVVVITPALDAAGPVSAASLQGGGVSPGEVVTMSGSNMGPADPRASAAYETLVAGTRVLFDGVAAPLVSVSASKVTAIVPFGVVSGGTTQVQVEYNGVKSAAVAVPVTDSVPGIYAVDPVGVRQILNEDGTPNTADTPAAPLSVVSFLMTGAGLTSPPSVDGQLAGDPPPALVLPVSATVGGGDARVVSAGPVAGMVNGIIRVSVEIPADAAADNAAPLVVTIGTAGSVPVTVAVAPAQ